ncbi:MAG: energy transducer TonB [Rhodanobacteraceae bacterium]|nr:energy transducer TonB [Rhodanobacteraceae bacterium]
MNSLLIWLAAALAPAGLLHLPPGTARVYARVDVDAQGRIQSVRFRDGTGQTLQAILRERIQSWQFDPATANGRPVAAQTTITIDLKARIEEQTLDIADVSAGVAPLSVAAPLLIGRGRQGPPGQCAAAL